MNELWGRKPRQFQGWGDDPYTLGSYACIPVSASFKDIKLLSRNVKEKVFLQVKAHILSILLMLMVRYYRELEPHKRLMEMPI